MTFDLVVLGVAALFGLLGIVSGAIKQLSHLAGLVLACFAARPLAAALAPFAAQRLGWPPILLNVMLSGVLFIAVAGAGVLVFRSLFAGLFRGREDGPANRVLGFVLGAGKAAAGMFVALSTLLFFEGTKAAAAFDARLQGSKAVAFVRGHNIFASLHIPALSGVRRMLDAQKDPDAMRALLDDPSVKALREDPRLKAILTDPAIRQAVLSRNTAALLANPRVKELLNDPNLADSLSRLQSRVR